MKKHILSIAVFFVLIVAISGQELKWGAGFNGFFDNREYWNDYVSPQTMFGARTYGHIGVALNEYQEFAVGIDYLFEFGGDIKNDLIKPIIYFKYDKAPVKLLFGAFPRINLIKMPQVLLTDTLHYYRPNVEGIFVEFRKPWGYHNVWLDWTSRQTDFNRETFLLGGTGGLNKGVLFYEHNFLMYHFAGPIIPLPDGHVRDNGGATVSIGLDFSKKTLFDTLRISTGMTFGYDRLREVYDIRYYFGSLTELQIQYKGIGVENYLYLGDGQVQMMGDGMYKAPFYNRTNFYWSFFRKASVNGRVDFSVHLLPEGIIDYSQRLIISMKINGKKELKPSL